MTSPSANMVSSDHLPTEVEVVRAFGDSSLSQVPTSVCGKTQCSVIINCTSLILDLLCAICKNVPTRELPEPCSCNRLLVPRSLINHHVSQVFDEDTQLCITTLHVQQLCSTLPKQFAWQNLTWDYHFNLHLHRRLCSQKTSPHCEDLGSPAFPSASLVVSSLRLLLIAPGEL
jgi:hypothetical protein